MENTCEGYRKRRIDRYCCITGRKHEKHKTNKKRQSTNDRMIHKESIAPGIKLEFISSQNLISYRNMIMQ